MLDLRVYRAAFLPAIVTLFLVAFSLGDPPAPKTTRTAPDAFDPLRAYGTAAQEDTLLGLAADFPSRRPGGAGDLGVAGRVVRTFVANGFATRQDIREIDVESDTAEGRAPLRIVLAEREGLSSRSILVVASRDRAGAAGLSGTAALLELARIYADRELQRTIVLASVSGGSGGFAGAREAARMAEGPVDAVIVLGDLAGRRSRRPWVVPWSASGDPAPGELRRTVEAALRRETGADPGRPRGLAQWARRTVPITVSEQGVVNGEGLDAVLVSVSGELGPEAEARVSRRRFGTFGRGVYRAITALEEADRERPAVAGAGIVTSDRLLPHWAVRLLVLTLLLPALLAAVDGFFRVRRRHLPAARWVGWAASWAIPFLLVWVWLRFLDVVRLVDALPAPAPPGVARIDAPEMVALVSALLVFAAGFWGVRRVAVAALRPLGAPAAGGGAAGLGLLMTLGTLMVWLANPYAAGVLLVAAHVWLLVSAPETRLRGGAAAGVLVAGLLLPLGIALYYLIALDLSAVQAVRLCFDLVAGGEVSVLDALAISGFLGCACAAAAIVRDRRRADDQAPPEEILTRGPRTYAGPGSLGGTESALRR